MLPGSILVITLSPKLLLRLADLDRKPATAGLRESFDQKDAWAGAFSAEVAEQNPAGRQGNWTFGDKGKSLRSDG